VEKYLKERQTFFITKSCFNLKIWVENKTEASKGLVILILRHNAEE
jgi:hypothetical protein